MQLLLISSKPDTLALIRGLFCPDDGLDVAWSKNHSGLTKDHSGLPEKGSTRPALILVEHEGAEGDGLLFLHEAASRGLETPIILLLQDEDSAIDLEAVRAGAADCLPISQLTAPLLKRAIRYALERDRVRDDFRSLASRAQCLLWHAEVRDTGVPKLEWWMEISDEAAAQRFLPLDIPPGGSYAETWYQARLDEDRDRSDKLGDSSIRAGKDYVQEFRCLRRDGAIRWLREDVRVKTLGPGRWQAVGICVDVTEAKQQELQIRQSEALFRRIFDDAPIGIALIAPDLSITRVNAALCHLLGYSAAELKELGVDGVTHPDDRAKDRDLSNETLAGKRPSYSLEKRYVSKAGEIVWGMLTATVVRDEEGQPLFGLGMVQDVTERRKSRDQLWKLARDLEMRVDRRTAELQTRTLELERRTGELEAANGEMEAFCYSISHDLHAPLRAINGFCHALEDDYANVLDEEGQSYLQRMETACARMGLLIDDLLNLSRISRTPLRREQVDLTAMAHDVLKKLRRQAPRHRAQVDIAPGLMAHGDPALTQLLLEQLLDNAWKFTVRSSEPRIEVGEQRMEDSAPAAGRPVYFVRDNGVGFEMRYARRLFDAFHKLHKPEEYAGAGMGLAIAQRIAQRHGGKIWAEGVPGEGAAFFFHLGGE